MTHRVWYLIAALVFVAGGIGAGWTVWSNVSQIGDAIVRFVVPGSGELVLNEPGTYSICHETDAVIDGRLTSVPTIAGLKVTVTDETSGAAIPVTEAKGSMSYTVGGHSGVAVLAFDAPHPGRYRFAAAYDNGRSEPKTVLTVDLGIFGRIFRTIGVAFGVGGVGAALALTIVLVTALRRQKMRRAAAVRFP